jgi:hypothetical protein
MQVVSELVGGFGASAIPTMIPRTAQRLVQGVKANLAPMTTKQAEAFVLRVKCRNGQAVRFAR